MIKEYIAYLKDNPQKYWFKAKLYGWGWTPARWQGWVTLLVFVALIVANGIIIGDEVETTGAPPLWFIVKTVALVAILLYICYKTGEKPRWQWGLPDKYKK